MRNKELEQLIEQAENAEGYMICISVKHTKRGPDDLDLKHHTMTHNYPRGDIMLSLDVYAKDLQPQTIEPTPTSEQTRSITRKKEETVKAEIEFKKPEGEEYNSELEQGRHNLETPDSTRPSDLYPEPEEVIVKEEEKKEEISDQPVKEL